MSLLVRDRPKPGDGPGEDGARGAARLARIDPRIEARRREVLAARRARRHRRMVVAAVVVTVLAAAIGLTRSAALDIDTITARSGTHTSERELRDAVGVRVGDHLVDLDLEGAETRLRALPWVKDVQLERFWRGSIAVSVTERVPVAVVRAGATGFLVDDEHRVLASVPVASPAVPGVPADLPVVEAVAAPAVGATLGPVETDAVTVARALTPGLRTRVAAVRITGAPAPAGSVTASGSGIDLVLKPAGVARLGSADDLDQKIVSLQTVFAQVDLQGLCVVDVRVADAPVLTRGTTCA